MELLDYHIMSPQCFNPNITVDKLPSPTADDWSLILCEADGNCFYHALGMSSKSKKTPLKIRKDMIKYIHKINYSLPNISTVVDRIFSGIDEEIEGVQVSPKSWANHEEMNIVAKMYSIGVVVWNSEYQMWTAAFPDDSYLYLSQCKKVVYMHHDGLHFNLLVRKCSSYDAS